MAKKLTTEEFIKRAKEVHGDKYDYSKTDLDNRDEKGRVIIICHIHGEFWQLPNNHIHNKCGCNKCGSENLKSDKDKFIEKARKIHGDKYNYDKVVYIKHDISVTITCPIHGDFTQTPTKHLSGKGCFKCACIEKSKKLRKTTEQFIEEARKIHGDKYDYSKLEYINNHTDVIIICPIHGEVKMSPENHLGVYGCTKCANKNVDTIDFIKKARKVHGDKYDYSKVEYKKSDTPVIITCTIHGDFPQTPNNHLSGKGCSECKKEKIREYKSSNANEFIYKSRLIHGDKYNYSKVEYINNHTDVIITCPIHGDFQQTPNNHLNGKGCDKCAINKNISENRLKEKLLNQFKTIEYQKKFDWLGLQSLEFYLPQYNIAIECQGKQHFKPIKYFGDKESFEKQIERDWRKIKLCEQNGVKLLHFAFSKEKDFENCGYEVINDVDKLISIIKESVE